MSDDRSQKSNRRPGQATLVGQRHCKHLRTKSMYIPDLYRQPGFLEASDTAHYWCQCTMREVGPDDGRVHRDDCTAERSCHEEL